MNQIEVRLKVAFIGEIGAGKSKARKALAKQPYDEQYKRTIGFDYAPIKQTKDMR